MKHQKIWTAGIALALTALLSGCAFAAAAAPSQAGGYWSDEKDGRWTTPTGEMEKIGERTVSSKDVNALSLNLKVSEVELLPSADSNIRLVFYANWEMEEKEKPVVTSADGTLTVTPGKWMTPWEKGWLDESYRNRAYRDTRSQRVELYLPAAYRGSLSCTLEAVSFKAGIDLTLQDVRMDLDAVEMTLLQLNAETLNLDMDAASVSADGLTVGTGELDMDASSATLKNTTVKKSLSIDCDAGTASCEMAKNSSFTFSGDWSLGSVDTYFPVTMATHDEWGNCGRCTATVGKGGASLHVNATCGSVSITEKR